MWQYIVAAIASAVFSYVLTPKPDTASSATTENFDFSTVQRGEAFLVMRGTRDISPAVVWWGRLKVKTVTIGGGKK